jgi:hypothetical protein
MIFKSSKLGMPHVARTAPDNSRFYLFHAIRFTSAIDWSPRSGLCLHTVLVRDSNPGIPDIFFNPEILGLGGSNSEISGLKISYISL